MARQLTDEESSASFTPMASGDEQDIIGAYDVSELEANLLVLLVVGLVSHEGRFARYAFLPPIRAMVPDVRRHDPKISFPRIFLGHETSGRILPMFDWHVA